MSKINDNQITQVKDATNIVDVISKFITLNKKGSGYVGLCPFHGDSHPSMRVDPNRQSFKCFVCGKGGDVFTFLQEHENMTFTEAVRWCANLAGIEIEETEVTDAERTARKQIEGIKIAIESATYLYQERLNDASEYLLSRGYNIDDDVIKAFQIGYAPKGNIAFKELQKKGYSQEYLELANVIGKSKYGSYYDVFQDRLMFPFLDNQGQTIGFSGRILQISENSPKYVNTNDTPIYKKGKAIFGLYQARQSIGRMSSVYLVEGQFDVISMHAAGVRNTVAGSGTALTDDQIRILSRYTKKCTIIYDSDKAGIAATLKNCKAMMRAGFFINCVLIGNGKDPDDLAKEEKDNTSIWLSNHTIDIVAYYCTVNQIDSVDDVVTREERLKEICEIVSNCNIESLRETYMASISKRFGSEIAVIRRKVKTLRSELPDLPKAEKMKPGVYGLDAIPEGCSDSIHVTSDFDEFLENYDDEPVLLFHESLSQEDVQNIRRKIKLLDADSSEIKVLKTGEESPMMQCLATCYKAGISEISGLVHSDELPSSPKSKDDDDYIEEEREDERWLFVNMYVYSYSRYLKNYAPYDPTPVIQRCADIIACADDSIRVVNMAKYKDWLGVGKGELVELIKPYLAKRKSRIAINSQRTDDDYNYDPDTIPDYVETEPRYNQMYKECRFYPRLNKNGEPVCYIFKNSNDKGHQQVADFFMEPLLHIQSDIDEDNKRVVKINRRYYANPIFLEIPSKSFLKKSTIEERLIMLEAVNFTDGEEKHWTKIKEWMSRNFISCREIKIYGNQQTDGISRKEDNQFFAFANGIYHKVDNGWKFEEVTELGIVTHNKKNYYLPAFSKIYAGSDNQEKYELISTLFYKDVPADKQCSFEKWTSLMNTVYKINDNGKWAILFGIMCAFRSYIHAIDGAFTAPFFMGPMSSGKTQIAISTRSLFVSPKVSIFNLNFGTDAAMSTLMGTFCDVPVVLDEYNNKDISTVKFQALKDIVYDGAGKQKRKGTSSKDVQTDKVYAPVILSGQETPQRDDNALMSRIIVCEVPKPLQERTQEEVDLFQELKSIENNGLSNVLLDILQLRDLVIDKFKDLKNECYKELKSQMQNVGEIDRLMITVSMFLAMCKLIEKYTDLKLPFTYNEFFKIALAKIRFQNDLISKSDKLAIFFKSIDVMIDSQVIKEGRDFEIYETNKVTIKKGSTETEIVDIPDGTKVMFLRFNNVYAQYRKGGYDPEGTSETTLLQNIRSNRAYLGMITHKFKWYETKEMPRGELDKEDDADVLKSDDFMVKKMQRQSIVTTCYGFNYSLISEMYDINFIRQVNNPKDQETKKQDLSF